LTLTNYNIEQLIKSCRDGNQHAQLEVYNRYYKAMYNTALRIVKDRYEAEDIMQDSFLLAFTKLDSLQDDKTFGAWLKRIVVNNSIYSYKKKTKYQEVSFENVAHKLERESDDTNSTDAYAALKAKEVLKIMNGLKDNYRIALNLYLIEGYDHEEISEILNISYANCRTTISRAKNKLKQELQHAVLN